MTKSYAVECNKYCAQISQAINKSIRDSLKAHDEDALNKQSEQANDPELQISIADDVQINYRVMLDSNKDGKAVVLLQCKVKSAFLDDDSVDSFKAATNVPIDGFEPYKGSMQDADKNPIAPDAEGCFFKKGTHSMHRVQTYTMNLPTNDEELEVFKAKVKEAANSISRNGRRIAKSLDDAVSEQQAFSGILEAGDIDSGPVTNFQMTVDDVQRMLEENQRRKDADEQAETETTAPQTFQDKLREMRGEGKGTSSSAARDLLGKKLGGTKRIPRVGDGDVGKGITKPDTDTDSPEKGQGGASR